MWRSLGMWCFIRFVVHRENSWPDLLPAAFGPVENQAPPFSLVLAHPVRVAPVNLAQPVLRLDHSSDTRAEGDVVSGREGS